MARRQVETRTRMEPTVLLAQEVTRLKEQLILRDAIIRNLHEEAAAKQEVHDAEREAGRLNYHQRAREIATERDDLMHEVVRLRRERKR